jgi:signal transduction histidine kinase
MPQPSSSPGSAELEVVPVPHRLHGTPASYVSLKAGQPGMLVLALVLLLFALTAACLVIAWRRTGRGADAKGLRGRLREFGWCAALAALAAVMTANLYPSLDHGRYWWWLAVIPLVAAGVVLLRPRLAAVIVPASLIVLGLSGLGIARGYATGDGLYWLYGYGLARAGDPSMTGLILAQAWAAFLAGGWLAWRALAGRSAAARLVLGRAAAPDRSAHRYGLLLLPVCVAVAELVGSDAWLALMLVLLAGSMLVIRRWPALASRLAAAGLIFVGLLGLVRIKGWLAGGWFLTVGAQPSGTAQAYVLEGPRRFFGAVDVSSQPMAMLAAAEALAVIGLGCWLAPRAFPELRRALGLAPDAELTRRVERLTQSRAVAVDTAAADLRRLERDLHDGAQARLVALGMNLRAAERLIHTSPHAAAALVAEAREASAAALTELRELVRGVHPPVLADRGLTDAVCALALDSPLQVETEIDLPGRPPAPVETACYFALAEVLTNAAKHSGARQARIVMSHSGRMLRIEVTDFGTGGADPAAGSGLAGVERRLATFDGILAVSSPVGGPTIVVLEVPCALSSLKTSSC